MGDDGDTTGGVLAKVEQILSVLGYKVSLGSDLESSLATLRASSAQLVLIDVKSIAGSQGIKLIQAVRKLPPPLRTIVIRDSIPVHHTGIATLQKPFDLMALATTVRRVLDGDHR